MQHLYYEALLRRIHNQDELHSIIRDKLLRTEAGIFGENQVALELSEINPNLQWIANFQTYSSQSTPFQIDFILFLQDRLLILEVKNISGTVLYMPHSHEFHRVNLDGEVEQFRNPFDQAFRHQQLLSQLLTHHRINIPITYAVIMTNPHCKIDSSLSDYPILHLSYLRRYLHQLQIDTKVKFDPYSVKSFLLQQIQQIPPKRMTNSPVIKYGIICSHCNSKMTYQRGVCICKFCNFKSRDCLFETIRDYYLLIDNKISNNALRSFAMLDSADTAQKVLSRLNFKKVGQGCKTAYIIPPEFIYSYTDKKKWRKKDG